MMTRNQSSYYSTLEPRRLNGIVSIKDLAHCSDEAITHMGVPLITGRKLMALRDQQATMARYLGSIYL